MRDLFYEADKLHEECGVFGIYSHKDDVALNTYWGFLHCSTAVRKVRELLSATDRTSM